MDYVGEAKGNAKLPGIMAMYVRVCDRERDVLYVAFVRPKHDRNQAANHTAHHMANHTTHQVQRGGRLLTPSASCCWWWLAAATSRPSPRPWPWPASSPR